MQLGIVKTYTAKNFPTKLQFYIDSNLNRMKKRENLKKTFILQSILRIKKQTYLLILN